MLPLFSSYNGTIIQGGQRRNIRPHGHNARSTNKDARKRLFAQGRNLQGCFETVDLPTECIAFNHDIHDTQSWLITPNIGCHDDHSSARPHDGQIVACPYTDWFEQLPLHQQFSDGRALPPGDNEPGKSVEVLRERDPTDVYAETTERLLVLGEGTLQCQDTDGGHAVVRLRGPP